MDDVAVSLFGIPKLERAKVTGMLRTNPALICPALYLFRSEAKEDPFIPFVRLVLRNITRKGATSYNVASKVPASVSICHPFQSKTFYKVESAGH